MSSSFTSHSSAQADDFEKGEIIPQTLSPTSNRVTDGPFSSTSPLNAVHAGNDLYDVLLDRKR